MDCGISLIEIIEEKDRFRDDLILLLKLQSDSPLALISQNESPCTTCSDCEFYRGIERNQYCINLGHIEVAEYNPIR